MRKIFVCVMLLTIISMQSYAYQLVENGGFETGDFTGWDIYINTVVQTDTVYEGNYAAGLSVSDIKELWGFEYDTNCYSAFLAQILDDYNSNYDSLVLEFAYNVDVLRDWGLDNDDLYVGLLGINNPSEWSSTVEIYFYHDLVASGDTNGWQTYQAVLDLSPYNIDYLVLGFYFADTPFLWNVLGSMDASTAFIDAVSVEAYPVSEPATLFLLGIGLIGLAGLGRKKLRKSQER